MLERYQYVSDEQARTWLLHNGHDETVVDYFGDLPDEEDLRSPGRPEIGGRYTVALGDERLARIDAWADENRVKRAEALRTLVDLALDHISVEDAERPATRDSIIVLRSEASVAGDLEQVRICDIALCVNEGYKSTGAEINAAWDECKRVILENRARQDTEATV